ncbi:hypothetical protein [Saccharopolyspora sp. 6M]|uniref:hypothetical protein n=1 Tax=Saccharopolyspora sp. 6M TaxID=2877237 RepID=UPI001CD7B808|nr:hypothetical protein [Saccharopolyspora sp. 6M]MCA1227713.1 hypothetical protein [Saccharopolyspora sp. 6M]
MTDGAGPARGGGGGSLEAVSAQLAGISAQNEQLRAQVASGRLKIDPEAAEKAAQAYEKAQHRLNRLQRNVVALERVAGLGEYATGIQLAKKFQDKAINPEVGATGLLTRLSDELGKKAELFRRAAEEYRNTDESIAADLSRGEQR